MIIGGKEINDTELDAALARCVLHAKSKAQDTVPIDTGNMRYAAFKHEHLGTNEFRVYFNLEGKHVKNAMDGIAPYAKWTNERPVRTQGWFDDKTVQRFTEELAQMVTYMLMEFGVDFESVEINTKEDQSKWNTSNT